MSEDYSYDTPDWKTLDEDLVVDQSNFAEEIGKELDLTPMQERFVFHYVRLGPDNHGSGTQAMRMAGSTSKNLSVMANKMLNKDKIQEAVRRAKLRASQFSNLDAIEVVENYRDIYKQGMAKFKETGNSQALKEARQANESLGNYLGMFVERKATLSGNVKDLAPHKQSAGEKLEELLSQAMVPKEIEHDVD